MRTSKPIATISYNTADFLSRKLDSWKKLGWIEFAMWIRHEPEDDEKKAHYHVFIRPARLVQTMDLEKDSCEFDKENPEKPFKMIGFRVSKESDWLLYGLHDPAYMQEKGLTKQYVYSLEDVQSTDEDTFRDIISHMSDDRQGRIEYRLIQMMRQGMTWQEIVFSGAIPLRHIQACKIMYDSTAHLHQKRVDNSAAM